MGISIKTRNLKKNLAIEGTEISILKGVDIEIKEGEFIAILGPSGCGKTTLLGLMAGLDAPSSGEILLGGLEIGKLKSDQVAEIRNREIGVVYQFFNLIPTLSALENVELPLQIRGGNNGANIRKKAVGLLERVGLKDRINHRPNQLSGGEQQRVAIARALIIDPSIILADEPTGNLDSNTGEETVSYLIRLIKENNLTAIIVTHDAKVASLADRILYMRDGLIVDEMIPEKNADKNELIALLNK